MAGISHVFTISRVAEMLGENEDWLQEISIEMDPEDGRLIVWGTGEQTITAFTDDARTWGVGLRHSSCEADEQSGAIRGGAGGAKGGGRGECEPAKHGPDTEPGNRVTGAERIRHVARTSRSAVKHPRWEPYA